MRKVSKISFHRQHFSQVKTLWEEIQKQKTRSSRCRRRKKKETSDQRGVGAHFHLFMLENEWNVPPHLSKHARYIPGFSFSSRRLQLMDLHLINFAPLENESDSNLKLGAAEANQLQPSLTALCVIFTMTIKGLFLFCSIASELQSKR